VRYLYQRAALAGAPDAWERRAADRAARPRRWGDRI